MGGCPYFNRQKHGKTRGCCRIYTPGNRGVHMRYYVLITAFKHGFFALDGFSSRL